MRKGGDDAPLLVLWRRYAGISKGQHAARASQVR